MPYLNAELTSLSQESEMMENSLQRKKDSNDGETKDEGLERGRFEPLRTGKTAKQRLRKKKNRET